jgi:hypothetical protein
MLRHERLDFFMNTCQYVLTVKISTIIELQRFQKFGPVKFFITFKDFCILIANVLIVKTKIERYDLNED